MAIPINPEFKGECMKEKRKYKWFSIEKITGERWHIGAFIASDDFDQFYIMIALGNGIFTLENLLIGMVCGNKLNLGSIWRNA